MVPQKEWMNAEEVAAYLGLKKSTVYQYVSDRRIPYHKIPGSQLVRFKLSEINCWMETGRISTQEEYLQRMAEERSG